MRVAPCVILLIAVCLGPTGCQTANKRPAGGGSGDRAFMGAGPDAGKAAEPSDPLLKSAGPGSNAGGFLAGQVVDVATGQGVDAAIQFVCLEEAKDSDRPIEVTTRGKGCFDIQGLKPGKHYKLIARTNQGERKLAGIVYTSAPNPNVFIKLKDDLASVATPPVPPPPAPPGPKAADPKPADPPEKKAARNGPERPASAVVPVWEPGAIAVPNPSPGQGSLGIRPPVPLDGSSGGQPPPPVDRSRITEGTKTWPPTAVIAPAISKTPVPSCVLAGKRLTNFALYDLSGQPWEYRTQRRGKLTLIDFWGTACIPCLNLLPHLSIYQQQYGPSGLQVIGIACEGSGAPSEQARRVAATAESRRLNYTILLGAGKNCPVQQQFGVHLLPTLVLIDEGGTIVWQHAGGLDRAQLDELERRIRLGLGIN